MHWNTPIYHEGFLYGCSGRNSPDAELRCVEWRTGKVKWTVPTAAHIALMYVDGYLVGLEERGKLMLFKANPERYELVAEVQPRAPQRRLFPRAASRSPACCSLPAGPHPFCLTACCMCGAGTG